MIKQLFMRVCKKVTDGWLMANHGYGSSMIDADKFGAVQPTTATKKIKVRIRKPSISIVTARDRGCNCSRIRTATTGKVSSLNSSTCPWDSSPGGSPASYSSCDNRDPSFLRKHTVDGWMGSPHGRMGRQACDQHTQIALAGPCLTYSGNQKGHVYPHPNDAYVCLVLEYSTWLQ